MIEDNILSILWFLICVPICIYVLYNQFSIDKRVKKLKKIIRE